MRTNPDLALSEFTVVANEEVARGVWHLALRCDELASLIRPGQFMNIEVPGDARHLLRIPLSYWKASPEAGVVDLVFAVAGEGTARLADMRPGEISTVIGPLGHGWRVPDGTGRALAVAGGVGAPPVVAACRALVEAGHPCDVVLGAQTAPRLWGVEAAREAGASEVVVATDDGSEGIRGFTTAGMAQLLAQHDYDVVMTCGPQPMMAGVARMAAERGIACQASMERMMTCGFGACNTCNVAMAAGGYRACCTDGPVFDAREVAW